MKQYQFKTNINCGGCVAKVIPLLNANEEIKDWNVDINNPSKILTVQTDTMKEDEIRELVSKTGFKAETLV